MGKHTRWIDVLRAEAARACDVFESEAYAEPRCLSAYPTEAQNWCGACMAKRALAHIDALNKAARDVCGCEGAHRYSERDEWIHEVPRSKLHALRAELLPEQDTPAEGEGGAR